MFFGLLEHGGLGVHVLALLDPSLKETDLLPKLLIVLPEVVPLIAESLGLGSKTLGLLPVLVEVRVLAGESLLQVRELALGRPEFGYGLLAVPLQLSRERHPQLLVLALVGQLLAQLHHALLQLLQLAILPFPLLLQLPQTQAPFLLPALHLEQLAV
jgi:hypothetical protein